VDLHDRGRRADPPKSKRNAGDRIHRCKGYASRSLNREGRKVPRRVFEVKYSQYIAFRIALRKERRSAADFRLRLNFNGYRSFNFAVMRDIMNAMAQPKPTSEELRAELKDLRSTATRLIEQASRLAKRCAELEDLISRGALKPTKS